MLEHSVTYALIEINDPAATVPGTQAPASRSQRAALIALDQMDGRHLQPDTVVPLLDSRRSAAEGHRVVDRRASPRVGQPRSPRSSSAHLAAPAISPAEREALQQKLAQFGENPAIQSLLGATIARAASKEQRVSALGAWRCRHARGEGVTARLGRPAGPRWRRRHRHRRARDLDHSLAARQRTRRSLCRRRLLRAARDAAQPLEHGSPRLRQSRDGLSNGRRRRFRARAKGSRSRAAARSRSRAIAAAALLEKGDARRRATDALASALQTAGPLELPRLLRAYDRSGDEAAGLAMIAALQDSKSRSIVRADVLRPLLAKYPESVRKEGEALLASLTLDTANQIRRLETLLPTLQGGDITAVRWSSTARKPRALRATRLATSAAASGPDLTRIGQVRSERDLLEAIVFPSASFARGYEPVVIRTRTGEVHSGVLRNNDLPDEIVLATERDETRIPRRDIVDMQPGTASLMPQGLADQLTQQELADLLAFLKATRSGA